MGSKGKDAVIGAAIGGATGAIASITLLTSLRHFYLDAGAPVQMTLQQPVTLAPGRSGKSGAAVAAARGGRAAGCTATGAASGCNDSGE